MHTGGHLLIFYRHHLLYSTNGDDRLIILASQQGQRHCLLPAALHNALSCTCLDIAFNVVGSFGSGSTTHLATLVRVLAL